MKKGFGQGGKRLSISKPTRQQRKNFLLLGTAGVLAVGGLLIIWAGTLKIPTLESFDERQVVESTKIYDRTGEILLYDVNQNTKRTVIPFEDISRNVKNATIAIEDQTFYQHNGVRPVAFLRAVIADIATLSFSQGGSTITQQVVKNSLLSNEKKISRKIKEWILAIKIEKILTKDEILNLYLNEIPYGGAIYGIEEASLGFFGKHASELTVAESAYLAALPQAPTYYSPYGNHRDDLENRKNLVLAEMLENGFLNKEEYDAALEEKVEFLPRPEQGIKAPHFVFYVIEELENKYGESTVLNGGLRVVTSLDYEMQAEGEAIALEYAKDNEEKYNAENAGFVAIDPKTGQILSMIGSRDYFDENIEGNFNIATAHRQPGSTFKPFVYAEAFNKGYTPETVVFDVKTQFSTSCSPDNTTSLNGCYSPENYDNAYRGPMTLRNALAQSVNIPSVKVLYLANISDSIRLAERMGITSLGNANQYGLTLVLGGGEVSLLDMVSAYGVFANEGKRHPYVAVLEVKDRTGKILEEYKEKSDDVLQRETALKISNVLSDNVARAPAFGQSSYLHFPSQDVAVKTGTTNDYKDAWIIGYTPNVVLGAWAGNNDNTPMEKRVAGFIVAPMWRDFMDKILAKLPAERFPLPPEDNSFDLKPVLRGKWQGGNSHLIDTVSGKNATEYTPNEAIEERLSGGIHSILYWVDKENPRGPIPTKPDNDSQFKYWEYGVTRWLAQQGISQPPGPVLPQGEDDVHLPQSKPSVSIVSPVPGTTHPANETLIVSLSINHQFPIKEVRYFVNGGLVKTIVGGSSSFEFIPQNIPPISDQNILKVVVVDNVLNTAEAEISFQINGLP